MRTVSKPPFASVFVLLRRDKQRTGYRIVDFEKVKDYIAQANSEAPTALCSNARTRMRAYEFNNESSIDFDGL